MQITTRQLESLQKRAESAQNRIKKIRQEAQEVVGVVAQTAEINISAFGFGLINGRYSSPEVVGIPVDLLAGGALHAVGFLLDEGGSHLHALANGGWASYFSALGSGIGRKMLTESQSVAVSPAG